MKNNFPALEVGQFGDFAAVRLVRQNRHGNGERKRGEPFCDSDVGTEIVYNDGDSGMSGRDIRGGRARPRRGAGLGTWRSGGKSSAPGRLELGLWRSGRRSFQPFFQTAPRPVSPGLPLIGACRGRLIHWRRGSGISSCSPSSGPAGRRPDQAAAGFPWQSK